MDRPGVECAHIATFMYTQHTHCYVHSVVLTNTCTYTHNDTHSHGKTMQDRLGQLAHKCTAVTTVSLKWLLVSHHLLLLPVVSDESV